MQPDGSRAYVACSPDDYVAVIDLRTLEVIGRIDAGRGPDGLAWAMRHQRKRKISPRYGEEIARE